ncbi:MAG: ribonuclease III [Lachnospiraceae bacterium]|nr:ribonuclease III [Lachnospiraceae bacterium]
MEESISFLDKIRREFSVQEVDIKTYSPQTLAFVGDCVYDLVIRTILTGKGNRGVDGLHKDKSNLVKAQTQAAMAEIMKEYLSPEEEEIYRRGRNTKTASHAKNAGLSDYRKATGFEALLGYLYLNGEEDRLLELVKLVLERYRDTKTCRKES